VIRLTVYRKSLIPQLSRVSVDPSLTACLEKNMTSANVSVSSALINASDSHPFLLLRPGVQVQLVTFVKMRNGTQEKNKKKKKKNKLTL
jgi:hypothetical protein